MLHIVAGAPGGLSHIVHGLSEASYGLLHIVPGAPGTLLHKNVQGYCQKKMSKFWYFHDL